MFSSEKCGAICFLSLCIVGSLFISQIGYGSGEGFQEGAKPSKNNTPKPQEGAKHKNNTPKPHK